ncbi:ABC transporter ATP-binding protein [Nonomuraea maritima]|uniref:ABC transporter ATP-binding protein n=1 Tax=Nonomuraea maritima TaxID=683260 RepID=UPI00371A8C31
MREILSSTLTLIRLTLRAVPLLATIEFVSVMGMAVAAPLLAYGLGLTANGLATGGAWQAGLIWLGVGLGGTLVARIASSAVQATMEDQLEGHLDRELLDLTSGIPGIAHHERPDIADRLAHIREESRELKYGATALGSFLAVLAGSATIMVLLVMIHPVLLTLVILAGVRIWIAGRTGRNLQRIQRETAAHHRKIQLLTDLAGSPRHGLEIRAYGLRSVLLDEFERLHRNRDVPRWTAFRRGVWRDLLMTMVFTTGYGCAIAFVLWQTRLGNLNAGDVAMVVLLIPQLDRTASGLATSTRQMARMLDTVANLRWLRRYAEEHSWSSGRTPAPTHLRDGIRLRNVSFGYPGSTGQAVTDLDLFLPAGSTVAIIGDNGAGKSTLAKLLLRLYDPTGGTIEVDGIDLHQLDPRSWHERTSAGFQDFVKYEFTAQETIGIGDLARMDDLESLEAAARRGGATDVVAELPAGLATQLGRRFAGGVDLSGGQWQRLALARAFMRTQPLLLTLDEPTAALDPVAEYALFERFAAASSRTTRRNGGITVLVSHRFSTVRMADLIVVMEAGRIIEVGTHHQLLDSGGLYHELFNLQAKAYM